MRHCFVCLLLLLFVVVCNIEKKKNNLKKVSYYLFWVCVVKAVNCSEDKYKKK